MHQNSKEMKIDQDLFLENTRRDSIKHRGHWTVYPWTSMVYPCGYWQYILHFSYMAKHNHFYSMRILERVQAFLPPLTIEIFFLLREKPKNIYLFSLSNHHIYIGFNYIYRSKVIFKQIGSKPLE